MSSSDQQFLDYLHGVSKDIRNFSAELADAADQHIDHVAYSMRDFLSHQSWIPEKARPKVAAPPSP
ncbi:hypothetical protein LTS18_003172, partial [Coniosporium uncinatum]